MAEEFVIFIGLLFLLAVIVREDFVFTLLYLFVGTFIVGSIWSRKAVKAVRYKRTYNDRVFLNEEIPVKLEITNDSWMPVVWLKFHESLPVDLSIHKYLRRVLTLGPYEHVHFDYVLQGRKRGYYNLGPLFAATGDLLGLVGEQSSVSESDYLTVYPKIVPLTTMRLPSQSPMGTMRHTQPIFEDPSRVMSKRDYVAGDSLRRIDWKASAASGRLQVKQFEPSIALETSILLNLNSDEYDLKTRIDTTELAITLAASIASWINGQKQSAGLITNGLDPFTEQVDNNNKKVMQPMQPLPPRKGRAHLIRILDLLARTQAGPSLAFVELIRREYFNLPWGTTMILITAQMDELLINQLFQARRAGLNTVIILVGGESSGQEIRKRAEHFNFPVYLVRNEQDIDQWRR